MPKKYHQKSLLTKPQPSSPPSLSSSRPSPSHQTEPSPRSVNDLIRESRRTQLRNEAQRNPPTPSLITSVPPSVRTSNLPGGSFPPSTSLQHLILTKIASQWAWHAENDADWLYTLPSNLKQTLLSYLSVYNEAPINPLRLLFPEDATPEYNDRDEVHRLDMGNALGLWTSMKGLERDLFTKNLLSSNNNNNPEISQAKITSSETPDHWDADDDSDNDNDNGEDSAATSYRYELGTVSTLKTRHNFANLKHLSLAISPFNVKAASWASLLTVAGELGTLTSLSLAYWPQPTFTPNAASTRITVRAFGQSVVYGGSNMYTAHDDDWREAAGILRTLSRSLYCLRWLDLTGCGDWYAALLWSPQPMALGSELSAENIGPEWNGGWRGLEELVLRAGWKPVSPPSLSSTAVAAAVAGSSVTVVEPAWNVEHERMVYRYNQERQRLSDIHTRAREVANHLRRIRKAAGGRWIEVDCGDAPTLSD
ncbi:hypothetical protein, variant [Exophiala mesophila]|uniref:Tafazzin n=1 Tax=Exophiala mesophila TaxID=212818 RepID=A0A0D1ZE67_EXOME|nr:hypothetical protein, variant [Exophiala mesophila]KIV92982.1 hypothetical protein, variant [Exophiala mesophila]